MLCVSQHPLQPHHHTPPPWLSSKANRLASISIFLQLKPLKQKLTPVKCSAASQSGFVSIVLKIYSSNSPFRFSVKRSYLVARHYLVTKPQWIACRRLPSLHSAKACPVEEGRKCSFEIFFFANISGIIDHSLIKK